MSVPDYTQCFPSDLPAPRRDFVPGSLVHFGVSIAELAREGDDLGDDEFCDGAGVGKGRVEHANTAIGGRGEVNLVGADTETADRDQIFGMREDTRGDFGFGADSEDVNVPDNSQYRL